MGLLSFYDFLWDFIPLYCDRILPNRILSRGNVRYTQRVIIEIRDEIVALSGTLRRNEWRTIEAAVNLRLRKHPRGIVVDCSELKMVTPEGAETFRSVANHLQKTDARFVVASLSETVAATLRQIPNLFSQMPVADTVADARTSLGMADVGLRATKEPTTIRPVIVGLLGTESDSHAVALGCRLARQNTAPVYLVQMLQVPRNMPLLSALGAEEEGARSELMRYETAVRQKNLVPVVRIERTRAAGERLVQVAQEAGAQVIALAVGNNPETSLWETVNTIVRLSPCHVLVNRLDSPQKTTL